MAWRKINQTRRFLLVILAVAVLSNTVQIWPAEVSQDSPQDDSGNFDFMLKLYGGVGFIPFKKDSKPDLPMYDPASDRWTLSGDPLNEFSDVIDGLAIDEHNTSYPFVIVDLPADATVGTYRKALASLTWHGICRVGVYSPHPDVHFARTDPKNPDWRQEGFVDVYHVFSVKRGGRTFAPCEERFPFWRINSSRM